MIRLVSKGDFQRVIKLHYVDMEAIAKFATESKWKDYAVLIKLENAVDVVMTVKKINRTAYDSKWNISAKAVYEGVEVIRYA
jgi:hypothetical protein